MPSTTVNTATVEPMPSERIRSTLMLKAGLRTNCRRANERSCTALSNRLRQRDMKSLDTEWPPEVPGNRLPESANQHERGGAEGNNDDDPQHRGEQVRHAPAAMAAARERRGPACYKPGLPAGDTIRRSAAVPGERVMRLATQRAKNDIRLFLR